MIESTRSLASAGDVPEAMSLFARELTLLFETSACLISSVDLTTRTVTDWAAHVIPPAQLNIVAEQYELDEYPATRPCDRLSCPTPPLRSAMAAIPQSRRSWRARASRPA